MEFYRYLAIIRRRWFLVIVTLAAAVAAGWLITPHRAFYTANSTIYVGNRIIDGPGLSSDRAAALDRVLATYALMVDSEPIAAEAISRTGVARTSRSIVAATTVIQKFPSQLIEVRVTDREPSIARDVANGLADAFVAQVEQFEGAVSSDAADLQGDVGELPAGLPAYVFERAQLPTRPQPTDLLSNLILAGLFGLVASCLLAFGLEYLDITVRSAGDAERRLGLSVLGVVPKVRRETLGVLRASSPDGRPATIGERTVHA